MNINKANRRDKQWQKKKNGMQEDNRSIKNIQRIQIEKSEKIKKDNKDVNGH